MKRAISFLFALIVLIIISGVASAACTNDNQTIMRLYSSTNTHGALWYETAYTTTICYDTIFGAKYSPDDSTPHACTSDDKIISLNGAINAHASSSVSGTIPYTTIVCHKGLKNCNTLCTGDKKPVVYLSLITNAHLSNTPLPGYFAICCNKVGDIITPPPQPTTCQEYTSLGKDLCESVVGSAIIVNSPGYDSTKACTCFWSSNACGISCVGKQGDCNYRCVKTVSNPGECDDETGMKSVTLKAEIIPILPSAADQCTGVTDCKSGAVDAPCGFISAELPFFGAWQFTLSICAMLLIYLVVNRKRQYS